MWNLKTRISIVYALALSLSACSLKNANDDSSLYVDLSGLRGDADGARFDLTDAGRGFLGLTTTPPTTAAGFSCYAVNVTGPGIPETGRGDHNQDPMIDFYKTLNLPGNYCAYRGVVTPPIRPSLNGAMSATLQVPPGTLRLVQIVGVNDPVVCGSGVVDDPDDSDGDGSRFFEVGRAVLNDLTTDRSVDVAMNWPATAAEQAARAMDCGNAGCHTDEHYPSSSATFMTLSTISMYAQKIATVPGEYLKAVELPLALSEANDVTVTIYQAGRSSTVPLAATAYSRTLTLPPTAGGVADYVFPLGSPGNYLMTDISHDYWIVLSAGSTNGSVGWQYQSGTSSGTAQYSGTWSIGSSIAGLNYRMRSCPN